MRSRVALQCCEPFDPDGKADGGDGLCTAQSREQSVVASARNERSVLARCTVVQFEYEARVIIEPAAKRGGEPNAPGLDAAPGKALGSCFQQVERGVELDLCVARERTQFARDVLEVAGHGEEFFDQRADFRR